MPAANDVIGDVLDAKGWQCGATVPPQMYPVIGIYLRHSSDQEAPRDIKGEDWLVVLSQTCDIVAKRLAQVPLMEILWCHAISKRRREFTNRRSTRHLDFRPNAEHLLEFYLTAHATNDRYTVPRGLFAGFTPREDRSLSVGAVEGLQQCHALRYTRPAWPQDFVDLVKSRKKDLEDALADLSDDESELRVTPPVAVAGTYRLGVYLVIDEEMAKDSSYRQSAQLAFFNFISALRKCDRIEIDDSSGVVAGNEFSWQQIRMTDLWNFAFLTPIS
jgi:hypothetical protein